MRGNFFFYDDPYLRLHVCRPCLWVQSRWTRTSTRICLNLYVCMGSGCNALSRRGGRGSRARNAWLEATISAPWGRSIVSLVILHALKSQFAVLTYNALDRAQGALSRRCMHGTHGRTRRSWRCCWCVPWCVLRTCRNDRIEWIGSSQRRRHRYKRA